MSGTDWKFATAIFLGGMVVGGSIGHGVGYLHAKFEQWLDKKAAEEDARR